jgi:hypothetical protein
MSDTSQGLLQRRRNAEGTDWRNYAACRDVDPDLFFPLGTSGASLLQIDEAKQVCQMCPVCADRACGGHRTSALLASGAAPLRRSGATAGGGAHRGIRAARRVQSVFLNPVFSPGSAVWVARLT